jgi:hypothetical protein
MIQLLYNDLADQEQKRRRTPLTDGFVRVRVGEQADSSALAKLWWDGLQLPHRLLTRIPVVIDKLHFCPSHE